MDVSLLITGGWPVIGSANPPHKFQGPSNLANDQPTLQPWRESKNCAESTKFFKRGKTIKSDEFSWKQMSPAVEFATPTATSSVGGAFFAPDSAPEETNVAGTAIIENS
jgi:hypothetical protein